MSMTPASEKYFEEVAEDWDELSSDYFRESVRATAIQKAYLRPEMVVADIGAGTGFMTVGLAPLVREVHLVDGSPAMLAVAQKNLAALDNVVYHLADGLALPLLDGSLDAAFANMYLHHCPDPLAAIQEMVRALKPGGRLVITDLDTHTLEWMKEEMADVWMGFERSELRAWFEAAGLVNILVDCTGQTCCAESQSSAVDEAQRLAQISIFVATGTKRVSGVRSTVQNNYGALAESGGCCGPVNTESLNCCAPAIENSTDELIGELAISTTDGFLPDYSLAERLSVPFEAADFSLGCGNPTALAGLQPGEIVLDIGSGGGLDAFLAAQKVGPTGKVIGVDMTPAMLERARRSAARAGLEHVEFRQGMAESLPIENASVDVILSNCVINLTEDKGKVFQEAFRVLQEGGRLEISDMVTDGAFPLELRQDPSNWASCVFGALPETEYLDLISQAGFTDVVVRRSASAGGIAGVRAYSITVSAHKPVSQP